MSTPLHLDVRPGGGESEPSWGNTPPKSGQFQYFRFCANFFHAQKVAKKMGFCACGVLVDIGGGGTGGGAFGQLDILQPLFAVRRAAR